MQQVLIIEDDESFREYLETLLWSENFCVTAVGSTHDAFAALQEDPFDLILCDLHLPFALDERIVQYQYSVEVGIRTVRELRWALPDVQIVAMTAALPCELERISSEPDFVPILYKPFSPQALFRMLRPGEIELFTALQ